ncbi:U32 family peptidase [Inconstantimicrobium mannanitabidum]|uniref:Peptidase U32 n=1 Tax=Inconstantimicrobium mannanitabidum TaxID=1604901 RepID=A0ACB5RA87_9CLOT|nr:U32 family peptidase [Clostridium sp. TW13]GKX66098.1 peptidase U32 [Clostridium sp. TW13]
MNNVELLAPAGSMESLYAAVNNGADAVYLGGDKFSARAYASNFDKENIEKAINYAHSYDVKVYVTINILLKEEEVYEALEYAKFLYSIGVDALIIQDIGLFKLIKEEVEGYELHASTQMTIHNGEAAAFYKNAGFHRVVLSRELSLKEIEYISKDLNIETEIFVHGALCVSYSGQCLMSSMIGGRSGNRGRCAQACRLPYKLVSDKSEKKYEGYLLSPKDISTYDMLKDLLSTGTSSLKVEGRMKKPEYVAGVVSEYRKNIDAINANRTIDTKKGTTKLLKLFNREGFSQAFFYKNTGRDMMAYNMPKNSGIGIGKVEKNLIKLTEPISKGDGIRYNDKGFVISKILVGDTEVQEAKAGDVVKILPKPYKNNDILFKTSDVKLNDELALTYRNPYEKKIELEAEIIFKVNEPLIIKSIYNDKEYKVKGEIVQTALKQPITKEKIETNILKNSDNQFKFSKVSYEVYEEGFLPLSSINAARREILNQIYEEKINKYKRRIIKPFNNRIRKERVIGEKEYYYIVRKKSQLNTVLNYNVNNVIIDMFTKGQDAIDIKDIKELGIKNFYLKLPNIIKNEFVSVCSIIDELLPDIKGLYTGNVGIINKYNGKTKIIGDYKINIMNSKTMEFYGDYLDVPLISLELNRKELKETCKKYKGNIGYTIYGKTELMVNEYCVIGSTAGGKTCSSACNKACERDNFVLIDRMNEAFTVITDKYCRTHLYNSVPLCLIKEKEDLYNIGINKFIVEFTDEDGDQCENILNWINKNIEIKLNCTKGHYKRGVE